jgi:hypothetical protein
MEINEYVEIVAGASIRSSLKVTGAVLRLRQSSAGQQRAQKLSVRKQGKDYEVLPLPSGGESESRYRSSSFSIQALTSTPESMPESGPVVTAWPFSQGYVLRD